MNVTPEVKDAILALADRHGGVLQAAQVVDAAADPTHPAHNLFEWDDAKAAIEHRLSTARILIRTIRVEVETVSLTGPTRVPAFSMNPSGGYATLAHLREDPDAARESATAEFARAAAALKRARQIGIELGLGRAVEATIATLIKGVETSQQYFVEH